jgi:hypothetical protein
VLTQLDNGSDGTVITTGALKELGFRFPEDDSAIDTVLLEFPDGKQISARSLIATKLLLAKRVLLRDIEMFVIENEIPFCLVGRPILKELGIDPMLHLKSLLGSVPLDDQDPIEDSEWDVVSANRKATALEALRQRTSESLENAGYSEHVKQAFSDLVEEFSDIFRVGLDKTRPIPVQKYTPSLPADVEPVKAKLRRYNPEQSAFLKKTVNQLVDLKLLYRNPSAKWSSAVFLPPKGDSFRFTVDLRKVNQKIIPRAWTMPFLEIDLERAVSSGVFAVLDNDNGYFQIENDPAYAEVFSILTVSGFFVNNENRI